jgi:hypothetical protein
MSPFFSLVQFYDYNTGAAATAATASICSSCVATSSALPTISAAAFISCG